jgi:hypothetical protein
MNATLSNIVYKLFMVSLVVLSGTFLFLEITHIYSIFYLLSQDLQPVDHNKVYYSSFRKDFYVEVPELARMTTEGNP